MERAKELQKRAAKEEKASSANLLISFIIYASIRVLEVLLHAVLAALYVLIILGGGAEKVVPENEHGAVVAVVLAVVVGVVLGRGGEWDVLEDLPGEDVAGVR